MEFTIYTLGDVALFRNALNGVAMMFTVAQNGTMDIWASNTGWGLGLGALLGALMALLIMVYNGALKRQLDWRNLLLPLLLYYVLTVPKATVVIMDSYSTSAPSKVDNVPLGLAFPLGIISQITHSATIKLETVFYVPYDGFTKITDQGYVAPLKLLNAVRYTGITASGAMPNLQEAVNVAHNICLTNNPDWDVNTYQNSIDSLAVFIQALQSPKVQSRYTKVPTANAGFKVLSCTDLGAYIQDGIDAYITGNNTGLFQMLSNEQLKTSNLKTDAMKIQTGQSGSKQGMPDMSTGQIIQTMANMAGADNATIMAFMQQTVLNPTLSAVTECAIDSDPVSQGRCASYYTSVEQWKEKAAADASGFVAIMRDGQNLLIVLSIILFPIMVVILVLQGQSAMKILGSYILYTVSAFMWLPVAAIINYYTHLQLHEELEKWNPEGKPELFLSLKNAPAFYDAVSKKLALANHALASVPMICMGLFSGMLMTMNRLSDRWNTQSQYYDPKTNVPDAVKRGPIAEVGPSYSASGMNSNMMKNGVGNAWDAQISKEASNTLSQINGLEQSNSKLLQQSWQNSGMSEKSFDEQYNFVKSALKNTSFANAEGNVTDETVRAGLSYLKDAGMKVNEQTGTETGTQNTNQNATVIQGSAKGALDASAGAKGDGKAFAQNAAKASANAGVTTSNVTANQTSANESDKKDASFSTNNGSQSDWATGKSSASTWSNQQKKAFESNINASLAQQAKESTKSGLSSTQAEQLARTTSEYKQNQEAISNATRLGFSQKVDSTQFANRLRDNDDMRQNANALTASIMADPNARAKFEERLNQVSKGGYAESGLATQGAEGRQTLSNIIAVQTALDMGGEHAKNALAVFAPTATGPKTIDQSSFSTNSGIGKEIDPHIAKVEQSTQQVKNETANLGAQVQNNVNSTKGLVNQTYNNNDGQAKQGVNMGLQNYDQVKNNNDDKVAVRAVSLRNEQAKHPYNPNSETTPKE